MDRDPSARQSLMLPLEIEHHLLHIEARYVRRTLRTAQNGSNSRNARLLSRVGLNFFCYQRAAEFDVGVSSYILIVATLLIIFVGGTGGTIGFALLWTGMFLTVFAGGFRMHQAGKCRQKPRSG